MLKFGGYYLVEPLEVFDGRTQEKSSYHISAYRFLRNGKVMICSKHDYLNHMNDFTISDFDKGCQLLDYEIGDSTITIKTGSEFGQDYKLIFHSNKVIRLSSTKDRLEFVPWEKVDSLNTDQIENAQIIHDLFGPFYHKKYRVFYQ